MKEGTQASALKRTWGTALRWWLFSDQGWPWRPLVDFLYELRDAFLSILRLVWFIIALPFWPLFLGLVLISPKWRNAINDAREKNRLSPQKIRGKFTISWR